jgi:type I restriction enzyme S subunit
LHDSRYWGYYLNSAQIVKQKAARGQGDAVVHIVPRELATIEVAFPLRQEQQRIAEALSDTDKLISSLSKTIEKKRLIKQGAMQQLLTGKKRLPGFDGEWVESELGTIVSIQRGSMLKSSEYQFGSIPVIAGGITPAGFHNIANRNGRTITISASGANAGYISYYKEPIFATDCSTISEGNDYFIDFIYYVLLLKQNDIFRLQTGGAQPHIHPKDIAPLKINLPCLYEEQVAIANILTTMDNEIESLEEERDKYIQLKEGMMHKLLTGQIRLVDTACKKK